MTSPLPHQPDENIPDPDVRRRIDDALAAYQEEMQGTPAARLAAQLVPVVPDGGRIGRAVTPHVATVANTASAISRWAPALLTSGGVTVTVLALPLTPSLDVYAFGLVGYSWWHCCGRPGPLAWLRMITYLIADTVAPLIIRARPTNNSPHPPADNS